MSEPLTRSEALLTDIRDGTTSYDGPPRSRVEALLMDIRDGGGSGGGGDLSGVGLTLSGRTLGVATDGTGEASVTLPPDEDTDTWLANTAAQAGYVAAGAGNAGRVWKTDSEGVPAWREDSDTTYEDATATAAGLMSAADKAKLESFDVPSAAKTALSDYTLSELAAVADEISALGTSSAHYAEFQGYLGQTYDFGAFAGGSTLATLCEEDSIPELDRHVIGQLVGVLHDGLASDSTKKAGLTFLCGHSLPYTYQIGSEYTNSGGWSSSKMRTTLNSGEVWQSLPSGLKDAAVSVLKQTNNAGKTGYRSAITATSDKFWLASAVEMWGTNIRADSSSTYNSGSNAAILPYEGAQYAYFANQGITWTNYSALANRNQTNTGGTVERREGSLISDHSALRSPDASNDYNFLNVDSEGWRGVYYGTATYRVCLGFCLGAADRPTAVTASERAKLSGISEGAEVNQSAFSSVVVGNVTVEADAKTDALTLAAGSNVALAADASTDTVTISATDTTYSAATAQAAGLMSAAHYSKLDAMPPVEVVSALPASPVAGTVYVVVEAS